MTALFLWPHIQVSTYLHCLWLRRPGLVPITSLLDDYPSPVASAAREILSKMLTQIILHPCLKHSSGFHPTWNKIHSPHLQVLFSAHLCFLPTNCSAATLAPCCSSDAPNTFLLQRLCTCCAFLLEHPLPSCSVHHFI